MLKCSNLEDLFEQLEDQPYDDEIEVYLEPGLHELSKIWRIRHHLILRGEEQLTFEKEVTIAPHLQITSYHQAPTTIIFGDFSGVMIEIESNVTFKHIEIMRGKNDLLPSSSGACIGVGKNASFKANDCVFKSMQPIDESKSENNLELDKNAYLELSHCHLISNSKAHGIKVYEQGAKSKRKYNVVVKNCQFKNHLTSFYAGEFSKCKLSNCHIENSIENAIYFFGDVLEVENAQIYDSGHHAISVISGHVSLTKIFVDQAKFSAISAYIKPKSTDLHRDEIKYPEDYQIVIDDLEGHHLGESLIFLHDATTTYAKNLKAKHIKEVACKASGASKMYIENLEVEQCEGCSIAVIDVSQMILKKASLASGKWRTIYTDACSELTISDINPVVELTQFDMLGCSVINCEKGDSFEDSMDELEDSRTVWDNEKWLSIIKNRSDRFGQTTRERMAILYEQFAQKYINENSKFSSGQFLIREYLKNWGEIGEKALYPFWVQLGSPDTIPFEQENKLLHRFELMKHTDIQSHDFLSTPIEGMTLINDTIFVLTHIEIYEYETDLENESLNFLKKYTAWPNQSLSFGKKWRMFDMLSQNSKLYMIFEAKDHYASTFAVNIFDYIDHQNEIVYLDQDCRAFYPKGKKIVSYGWDSFGHPTDRVTWKIDHNKGEYPSKEAIGYAGMIPKEPWLWHHKEQGGRSIQMKAFGEYHVTLAEGSRHLKILNSAYAQVFELKDKPIEYWSIDRDFVICASNHELFLVKKIRN